MVRLVALMLVLTCFVNVAISPPSPALATACAGDEQILLAPAAPRVGGSLMVAAMSGFPHEDVLLLGPNGPIPVARAAIGERFVWQEIVLVDRPGAHLFVFGVAGGAAPITACADASVHVAGAASPLFASLNSYGQGGANAAGPDQPPGGADPDGPGFAGAPSDAEEDAVEPSDGETPTEGSQPTGRRRRSTRTPTPRPDNGNENDNVGASEAAKSPTRTPTSTRVPTSTRMPTSTRVPTATRPPRPPATDAPEPTATDTPEPTPTLEPASISSLSPSRPICGQVLTIRGERFGTSRGAVDGQVRIDGREATIDAWGMSQIDVTVPLTVRAGNDRELEVLVAGRRVTRSVPITC